MDAHEVMGSSYSLPLPFLMTMMLGLDRFLQGLADAQA